MLKDREQNIVDIEPVMTRDEALAYLDGPKPTHHDPNIPQIAEEAVKTFAKTGDSKQLEMIIDRLPDSAGQSLTFAAINMRIRNILIAEHVI